MLSCTNMSPTQQAEYVFLTASCTERTVRIVISKFWLEQWLHTPSYIKSKTLCNQHTSITLLSLISTRIITVFGCTYNSFEQSLFCRMEIYLVRIVHTTILHNHTRSVSLIVTNLQHSLYVLSNRFQHIHTHLLFVCTLLVVSTILDQTQYLFRSNPCLQTQWLYAPFHACACLTYCSLHIVLSSTPRAFNVAKIV
jgi:hypothetical protein